MVRSSHYNVTMTIITIMKLVYIYIAIVIYTCISYDMLRVYKASASYVAGRSYLHGVMSHGS